MPFSLVIPAVVFLFAMALGVLLSRPALGWARRVQADKVAASVPARLLIFAPVMLLAVWVVGIYSPACVAAIALIAALLACLAAVRADLPQRWRLVGPTIALWVVIVACVGPGVSLGWAIVAGALFTGACALFVAPREQWWLAVPAALLAGFLLVAARAALSPGDGAPCRAPNVLWPLCAALFSAALLSRGCPGGLRRMAGGVPVVLCVGVLAVEAALVLPDQGSARLYTWVGPARARAVLAGRLRSAEPNERRRALNVAALLPLTFDCGDGERFLPSDYQPRDVLDADALACSLDDPDPRVRELAVRTLARIGDGGAPPPPAIARYDSDPTDGECAAPEVSQHWIPDPVARRALARLADDPSPDVRIAVADALLGTGEPEQVAALVTMAQGDPEAMVRFTALSSLARCPDARRNPRIIGAFCHGSLDHPLPIREVSAGALVPETPAEIEGLRRDPRVAPALLAALEVEDWSVQEPAMRALGRLGDRRVLPCARRWARNAGLGTPMEVLAAMRDRESLPLLRRVDRLLHQGEPAPDEVAHCYLCRAIREMSGAGPAHAGR